MYGVLGAERDDPNMSQRVRQVTQSTRSAAIRNASRPIERPASRPIERPASRPIERPPTRPIDRPLDFGGRKVRPLPQRPEREAEVVERAFMALRQLDRATVALTDALDVTGFPDDERRSERALLSTLASGMPAISLSDLLEALTLLCAVTGPRALSASAARDLSDGAPAPVLVSLPDEARELLYMIEPLLALASGRQRLPRHAGARLRAAPLTFCLTQPQMLAALTRVAAPLRQLMGEPLRLPELTTLPQPLLRPFSRMPEPTSEAAFILLATLIVSVLLIGVIAVRLAGVPLPFGIDQMLP